MKQVRHIFDTTTEANAFVAGVEYVNDSSLEVVDIEVGTDDLGPRSTVVVNDDDGHESEDYIVDRRAAAGDKP